MCSGNVEVPEKRKLSLEALRSQTDVMIFSGTLDRSSRHQLVLGWYLSPPKLTRAEQHSLVRLDVREESKKFIDVLPRVPRQDHSHIARSECVIATYSQEPHILKMLSSCDPFVSDDLTRSIGERSAQRD